MNSRNRIQLSQGEMLFFYVIPRLPPSNFRIIHPGLLPKDLRITAAPIHQLLVRAHLHNPPCIHMNDPVCQRAHAEAVRDDYADLALTQRLKR